MARSHIGVTTDVSVQSSPSSDSVPSGRLQLAGLTAKGPQNYSGLIRNINQYQQIFGGRTPFETLYDTVQTFFAEGGSELNVTRVVGPAASNGSVTLESAGETPEGVLTIEVLDAGAHSSEFRAIVTANTDNTFNVSVVDSSNNRVIAAFQRYNSPAELAIEASGNESVKVTTLGPTASPAPGQFNFSPGSDDRSGVTSQSYIDALNAHKGIRAGVAVAIPGQPADTIASGLGEHCSNKLKIGLLAAPLDATIEEAVALGDSLADVSYGAYLSAPLFPAIRVPDGADRTRTTSAIGYVAAHRSRVHRFGSYADAIAGPKVKALQNFAVVTKLDEEDINYLKDHNINGIVTPFTGAPYIYNWASLSKETGLYHLNVQDALNNLTVQVKAGLAPLIWESNDGREALSAQVHGIIAGIMQPLVDKAKLFPSEGPDRERLDDGYRVAIEDIRTSGQNAPYDELTVELSVKLSPTLTHIHVPIRKVDVHQTF